MLKTLGKILIVLGLTCALLRAFDVEAPSTLPTTQPATRPAKELTLDLGDGMMMKLVQIPAGKFIMGSPETEKDREKDEIQHEVKITKPFYMGVYEVTVDQYAQFLQETGLPHENPHFKQESNHPVVNVEWEDAEAFCNWLSKKTGKMVVLPTESQWEYACRAGTTTAYCGGDELRDLGEMGWYWNNSEGATHPVGQKKPNAFGLYDMHGNAFEWCEDWYGDYPKSAIDPAGPMGGNRRVMRGGSWEYNPWTCRSARRFWTGPHVQIGNIGMRVVVVGAE